MVKLILPAGARRAIWAFDDAASGFKTFEGSMKTKSGATNHIRGVDAIANMATAAWLKLSSRPNARLRDEERGALRRNKFDPTFTPSGVHVEILGDAGLRQSRNLAHTPGTAGGFATSVGGIGFVGGWEPALDALPMRRLGTVVRVDRGATHWLTTADDRTNGAGYLVSENAAGATADVAFGLRVFKPYKASSGHVLVPSELDQDGQNFPQQLGALLGRRVARCQNYYATIGSGTGQPLGVCAACSKVSAASAVAISGDDILNLVHGVGDGTLDGPTPPRFMMHRDVLKVLAELKDGQGRYLWNSDTRKLGGFVVTLNSPMASTIASGTVSVLFGNFSAVRFVEVSDVRLDALQESQYASSDQILYRAILRFDSQLVDAGDHPVVGLQH